MSFGYNANNIATKSVNDIDDIARMLLYDLRNDRQDEEERRRPLILIAHSLGGVIVKKVCIFSFIHA